MKKCILLIMMITLLPLSISTAQVPGDLNCTGSYNGFDVMELASMFASCNYGNIEDTSCVWINGDMNLDGVPHTIADWWMILMVPANPPGNIPPTSLLLDTIRIETVNCAPGDAVEIPVHIYSPDSISGAMLQINYDNTYVNEIDYDNEIFESFNFCIDAGEIWIPGLWLEDYGVSPGHHIMGNIQIEISESTPPGTVIPLELISEDYIPSGISNWSNPSSFKWATTVDGAVHVILTDIDENNLPLESSLKIANYPNPFNASTVIEFTLENESNVELGIYDITGRLIASPFKGRLMAGEHNITWNAGENSSGIYFYKLITSDGSVTKRMTLLK